MRILLKCPTRSRPQRVVETLKAYIRLANDCSRIGVALSCDVDDDSMQRNLVQEEISRILRPTAWNRIFFGPNKTKIEACNANMKDIDWEWDIVVLVSDDMIPQIKGYDDILRSHMSSRFPDLDGILWFNDGCQGDKLNTLCIYGRKMYESLGNIYEPVYKSLFCDTELTDRCRTDLASKCLYVPYCIIRHEHPGTGFANKMDSLYAANQRYWSTDMYTYIQRKKYAFDWSVLIPTIPGREEGLQALMASIREKVARICPDVRLEFCIAFDNREKSVGVKRQELLERAKGKYLSFIDDDDSITDAYVEDLWECMKGEYHTMLLRGQMAEYTFYHSTQVSITDTMATKDEVPVFRRPPNHLNPMMSDVAKLIPFRDATYGEDLDWTIRLFKTGLLTKEYRSDPTRVHYMYNLGQRVIHPSVLTHQQTMTYEAMLNLIYTPAGTTIPMLRPTPPPDARESGLRLGPKGFVSR
jgi:hypothetical protein